MGAGAARHSSALRGTVPCRAMTHHNKSCYFTASTATNGILCSRNKERHLRKACNHGSISVSFKTFFRKKTFFSSFNIYKAALKQHGCCFILEGIDQLINVYSSIFSPVILHCTFFFKFPFFAFFFCRNLRRLVHAMILKRPPHEWIGAFRLLFFLSFCSFVPYQKSLSSNQFLSNFRHFRQLGLVASDTSSLFRFSLGIAFAALGGILILKYLRSAQPV